MAAYTSGGAGVGNFIACDDDFCNMQSQLTLNVVTGEDYLIRVGGFDSSGVGTMVVSCLIDGCMEVSLINNEILINGTQGPDDIVVSLNVNMVEVSANECFETFPLPDVQRVVINAFGGGDTIRVDAPVELSLIHI